MINLQEHLSRKVFLILISILPHILILNLTSLNLAIAGVGLGALIVYFFCIALLALRMGNVIRRFMNINKSLFCFGIIILFLVMKQSLSNQDLYTILQSLQPFVITFIFYLIGLIYIKESNDRKLILKIILFNSFIGAAIGIIHFHLFPGIVLWEMSQSGSFGESLGLIDRDLMRYRETGTYSTASGFSHCMTFGVILAILKFLESDVSSTKVRCALLIAIIIYSILISYTRSPLIFIFLMFLFIEWKKHKGILRYLIPIGAGIGIYIFLYHYGELLGRLSLSWSGNLEVDPRWIKWALALKMVFENAFTFLFGIRFGEPTLESNGIGAGGDNMYIYIFFWFGLIGLLIYTFAFLCIFKKIRILLSNIQQKNTIDRYYVKSVASVLLAFLFFGLFSNAIFIGPENLYVFLLLGSLWNI